MSWHEDFSETDYQQYWNLTHEVRCQMVESAETPAALKALLQYQRGKQFLNAKDLKAAIAQFDAAIEVRSDWHEIWTERALALLKLGEYEAAIDSCNHAVELNPEDAKAWSYRGVALYGLRQYGESADSCDRAVELAPDDHDSWRTRSDALHQQQRYEEAVVSYDRALALQPQDSLAWGQRGLALQKLGRYEEAIASYDGLLEHDPENHKIWHKRGLALRRLGRIKPAIHSFNQALSIQPSFYAATRSKLFMLITSGQIFSYLTRRKTLIEQQTLLNDLRNVVDALVKTKLPTLVVLSLVVLSNTHNRGTALASAGVFLLITTIGDLMTESRN